jgi:tetratricopeptide (TPR) repeat protein
MKPTLDTDALDLVFDDVPIDTLLGLGKPKQPTPASRFLNAYSHIERIRRTVETDNTDGALALIRESFATKVLFPLSGYRYLVSILESLVPTCPKPIIDFEVGPIEIVLRELIERTQSFGDVELAETASTMLYRLYEGTTRYGAAREVLCSLIEFAIRRARTLDIGVFTNNYGYDYLLEGRFEEAQVWFAKAQVAFERAAALDELANLQANVLTCKFEVLQARPRRELLPQIRKVNKTLIQRNDWRARKTLILLARHAESSGQRAAAIKWTRLAIRVAASIPTRLRLDDELYLLDLNKTVRD